MGLKIKLRRIELGIKQKDLANIVGVSQQYLGKLENGKVINPGKDLMIKISKALDAGVLELFFSEEN